MTLKNGARSQRERGASGASQTAASWWNEQERFLQEPAAGNREQERDAFLRTAHLVIDFDLELLETALGCKLVIAAYRQAMLEEGYLWPL